jgi:hypothetical protein
VNLISKSSLVFRQRHQHLTAEVSVVLRETSLRVQENLHSVLRALPPFLATPFNQSLGFFPSVTEIARADFP